MSADDFQTQYASFMDGMLKSAVAETTKLFETMVDELKAEISRMKKENEDLKTRCSLYESAKSHTAVDHEESNTVSGLNDGSEKRDSAVQCDLVPVRTVLVERCRSLQNQVQQYTYEDIQYHLQEHNYIAHEIKQEELESVLKQEEAEPTMVCGQAGSLQASVSEAQNEEPLVRQESSTQYVETRLLDLPCLQMGSRVQGTQNQLSYPEPTIDVSLAAIMEGLQEESEFDETVSEKRMEGEFTISGKHQSALQHCQRDSDTSVNEQTNMHHTEKQSEPNLLICHRRGPPPKNMKQQILQSSVDVSREQKGLNSPSVRREGVFSQTFPIQPQKTSSAITPSVQKRLYPAFEDVENRRVDSLPVSVSIAIHSPSTEVSCANETLDTIPADSSQAPSSHLNDCSTSVTLQDAMLLVEAMNQSTVEKAVAQGMAPSETRSAPCESTLQMVDKIPAEPTSVETSHITGAIATSKAQAHIAVVIPKQKDAPSPFNTTTLPLSPSAAALTTAAQSLPHPLMSLVAPIKPNKVVPHVIIVTPKSRSSFMSQKVAAVSPTQLSTGSSSAQDRSSKVVRLSPHTSSHSSVPQTVNVNSRIFFPVSPPQFPTNSAEQHLGTLSQSKILIIPTRLSAVASRKHQSPTTVLTVKQNSAEPTTPVPESSTQLIFPSQELNISALHNPPLSKENDDTSDSLETSKQTASVSGTDTCSSLKTLDGQVPTSVFPVLPPAVEPKLTAVVRLTRLPFPISTKESVLVSRLSKGSCEGITLEKPLRPTVPLSEVPALSSSICSNLTETTVAVSSNTSQVTAESDNPVLFSETSNLAMDIGSIVVQDKQSAANLQVSTEDTPDPLSPAETPPPILQVTAKATSDNFTDARVLFSETRICDRKSLQKKLLVARLRSHLKSYSKARRPEATPKSCSTSPKMPTREGTIPQQTESTAASPRTCSYSKNDANSKMSADHSTFTINSPGINQIKEEFSSPFRLTRYSMQTDSTKKTDSETVSQSVEGPVMAESPRSFKILNSAKLTKATLAKMRNPHKSKLQKHQLAENQGKCEIVKICRAKVWIPPVMPAEIMSPAGERKSSLSLANTETKPNNQSFVCPPLAIRASPIVSPLEPLAVIGRHLLRNQCGECGRILSSSAALESHVGLHTGRRPFSCTLCGKTFPDAKSYKRHGRVHRNGRIHICQQCGKGFVYRFGLTKHLQMVHSKIKPFICQICNKGFFTKRDVEVHIRIHTGEKPFHCNYCDKRFTRRVELNVHLRWHNGEKRHWCPHCGKGFLDFNNLKRHKYIHTGEKPHSCPYCPKQFTQSGHLKKHVKNVHKTQ